MNKNLARALASVVMASSLATTMTPALARHKHHAQQERIVAKFCEKHPRRPACVDWRQNRHDWDEARYQLWFRNHHDEIDVQEAGLAALFGFAAGAVVSGALGQGSTTAPAGTAQ